MGSIREAMAYRVKYRLKDTKRAKRQLHLEMMCVHKRNRGGLFPMPQTVANLGIGIFQDGCSSEEANHEGVCVQEIPEGCRPEGWETSLAVNQRKTKGTLLEGCFPSDAQSGYGTLSHSHLLLTLLCWHFALKWPIPIGGKFEAKWKLVLDDKECLKKDAVASVEPELARILTEGLIFEILDWKMLIEEPTAASKISNALNKGQARALRTTELTAIAVLSGAMVAQASGWAQEAHFETVREKVRGELDLFVDDPDFVELFEFVLHLGAELNSFLRIFLDWASNFVDPKQRTLRLSAFGEANKLPSWAPRTKVAVIQRSYRKEPVRGACPNPEPAWGKAWHSDLEKIEHVLFYYQVTCAEVVGMMAPVAAMAFQANVAIASAESYISKDSKTSAAKRLLEYTKRYNEQLAEFLKSSANSIGSKKCLPEPREAWINYSTVVDKAAAANAKGKGKADDPARACLPRIVVHDEQEYRARVREQGSYQHVEKDEVTWHKLPWKQWLTSTLGQNLDAQASDMAAVIQVLRGLHTHGPIEDLPLDVHQKAGSAASFRVTLTKDVAAEELELPPCVPKAAKLVSDSSHPQRIAVAVIRKNNPEHSNVYYVLPEYKPPMDDTDAELTTLSPEAKAWRFQGGETMHPFWAVPRATEVEVQRSQGTDVPIVVNMELKTKCFQTVVVGQHSGVNVGLVTSVEIPILVNMRPLKCGARLYMAIAPKREAVKRPLSWKDAVAENEKKDKAKSAAPKPKAKIAKCNPCETETI